MRTIKSDILKRAVKDLCLKANIRIRGDVLNALKEARKKESKRKAKRMLDIIIRNASIAGKKKLPICQDTGMVVVYAHVGQDVHIKGDMVKAIEAGVKEAYKDGYFRNSVVKDPIKRSNTGNNLPPVIYANIVAGSRLKIHIAVKGFGCENVSKTKMFKPTDSAENIENFIVDSVKETGSRACPPMYIGIGMGGTLDKAVMLSKKATLRKIGLNSRLPHIKKMEKNILKKINKSGIGPMGEGGKTTILGVSILTSPTHIAGLPVALNISCHATRDAAKVI